MKHYKFISIFLLLTFLLTISIFPQKKVKGDFLTQAMDTTVNPGVDFFKYATGTWMKENPIPPTEKRWGLANLIYEENYNRLKGILQNAASAKQTKTWGFLFHRNGLCRY